MRTCLLNGHMISALILSNYANMLVTCSVSMNRLQILLPVRYIITDSYNSLPNNGRSIDLYALLNLMMPLNYEPSFVDLLICSHMLILLGRNVLLNHFHPAGGLTQRQLKLHFFSPVFELPLF